MTKVTEPKSGLSVVDGQYLIAIDSTQVESQPYNYTGGFGLSEGLGESNSITVFVNTVAIDKIGGVPITLDKLSTLPDSWWLTRTGIGRGSWGSFNPMNVDKVFTTLNGLRALQIDCNAGNESYGVVTRMRVYFIVKGKYMYAVRYRGTSIYMKNRQGESVLDVKSTPVKVEQGLVALKTFRL